MGGNCIKEVSLTPIERNQVLNTLRIFEQKILIPINLNFIPIETRLIGSFGFNKDLLNDLDLVFDLSEVNNFNLFSKKITFQFKKIYPFLNPIIINHYKYNLISLPFNHYEKDQKIFDKWIQIDLFLGNMFFIKNIVNETFDFKNSNYSNSDRLNYLEKVISKITLKEESENLKTYYDLFVFKGIFKTYEIFKNERWRIERREFISYSLSDLFLILEKDFNLKLKLENIITYENIEKWVKENNLILTM